MAIVFTCACGRNMRAKDELAGKRVKCSACGQTVAIPYPVTSATAAAPANLGGPAASQSLFHGNAPGTPITGQPLGSPAPTSPAIPYRRKLPVLPFALGLVGTGLIAALSFVGYRAAQWAGSAVDAAIDSDPTASLPYPLTVAGRDGRMQPLANVYPEGPNFFPLTATDESGARREGRAVVERQRAVFRAFTGVLRGIDSVETAKNAQGRLRDIHGQLMANSQEIWTLLRTSISNMEAILDRGAMDKPPPDATRLMALHEASKEMLPDVVDALNAEKARVRAIPGAVEASGMPALYFEPTKVDAEGGGP
jgi:hypothetical protein